MEKEFLLKEEYQTWLRDVKKLKSCDNYVSDIKSIDKNTHQFVQEYLYYVPALLSTGERVFAKQLLACVYADVCFYRPSILPYLKKYIEFIASITRKKILCIVQLDDNILQNIREYLNNRQVWVVEDRIARCLKTIAGDNKSTFQELFNIRIYSWNRPNFPLDLIKKVFKRENKSYMEKWVKSIRNNIKVITSKSGDYIPLEDIKAFDLQRERERDPYRVKLIVYAKKYDVWTPLANGDYMKMYVKGLEFISIDHKYPLDSIVKSIIRRDNTELEKIVSIYFADPKLKNTNLDTIDVNEEILEKEMDEIKEVTSYILMDRNENSRKSNISSFLWYEIDGCDKKFIVAENIIHHGKKYRVIFTGKDGTKRLERMNNKE